MKSDLQKKLENQITEIQNRITKETDPEMKSFMREYRNHMEEILLKEKQFIQITKNSLKL